MAACGCDVSWPVGPNPGSNCNGLRVQKGGRFTVLATADGATFSLSAIADQHGASAGRPGDFLELKPYGNGRYRLTRLWVYKGEATAPAPGQLIGFGEVTHNGKPVQFEMQGSFAQANAPASIAGCQEAQQCGWLVLNFECLPDFSVDDVLNIALVNYSGGELTDVDIYVELQQVG
jgi:hypothetical protein